MLSQISPLVINIHRGVVTFYGPFKISQSSSAQFLSNYACKWRKGFCTVAALYYSTK